MQSTAKIVKRMAFPALLSHLKEKEATILLGPRQVGKTTLMKELRKYLIEDKNVLASNIYFFNLDILGDQELFESQEKFISFLKERSQHNFIYVFIDEAQKIKQSGTFIKGVYDLGLPIKLILSGSSSLEIKNKLGEPLTGRKKLFTILPFSWEEFLDYKDPGFKKTAFESTILTSEEKYKLTRYLDEYLAYGGYPRVVTEDDKNTKKELLEEIYGSYIEKDIAGFLKIREPLAFSNLVKLLAIQNGQLANTHSISKALNLNQRTVEKYLYYLEQTFVIAKLPPFFSNAKKELVKMPKIYFFDTGLKNLLTADFSGLSQRKDKGELLENFVFNELKKKLNKTDKLNFWRSKSGAEVDFVTRQGTSLSAFEVKAKNENLKTEPSLKAFLMQYESRKNYILFGEGAEGENQELNISFKPIYKIPAITI